MSVPKTLVSIILIFSRIIFIMNGIYIVLKKMLLMNEQVVLLDHIHGEDCLIDE